MFDSNAAKFAALVSYVSATTGHTFSQYQLEDMHAMLPERLVKEPVEVPGPPHIAGADLLAMLLCFTTGKKIEAIKWFRTFTGWPLKDSKDAVEKLTDWINTLEIAAKKKSLGERLIEAASGQ